MSPGYVLSIIRLTFSRQSCSYSFYSQERRPFTCLASWCFYHNRVYWCEIGTSTAGVTLSCSNG